MELTGKSALLTGATGGLGRAIAAELAARGARLLLSARREAALEQLAAGLPGEGHRAITADLAAPGATGPLLERAGEIDVLVANAGVGGGRAIEDFDPEAVERVLRVNLEAPVLLCGAAVAAMRERGSGHVVVVSSLAAKAIPARSALYAASKSGLRAFGLGLRDDLHGSGVGVSVVSPGFVRDVGMFADRGGKAPPGVGTTSAEQVAEAVVDAIERNRGEVEVAPVQQRALANVAHSFHGAVSRLQRIGG